MKTRKIAAVMTALMLAATIPLEAAAEFRHIEDVDMFDELVMESYEDIDQEYEDLASASADDVLFWGDFYYSLLEDGTVQITDFIGTATDVVIPAEINGCKVTVIGERCFSPGRLLVSVTIPDGVTTICDRAFEMCVSLTNVTLPKSLTYIGERAFRQCRQFTEITIPDSVTFIGDTAFAQCRSLESIKLPSGLTSIGEDAFADTALTSVSIPKNVSFIGESVFNMCSSLQSVSVDEENEYYCAVDGVLFNKEMTDIKHYPSAKKDTSYTIPSGVERIDANAFKKCAYLKTVTIPSTVTSIPVEPFANNPALTRIDVNSDNPTFCSVDGVLFSADKSRLCAYPNGREGSYTVPDTVTSIDRSAFEGAAHLTEVTIPDSVTEIGTYAFQNCVTLSEVSLSQNLKVLDNGLFWGCTVLSAITIPDGVVKIGDNAFWDCTSLKEITIPDSVTDISDAFYGCTGLTEIVIPDSVTDISDAFDGCTGLTEIVIPDSVTNISGAFYGCTGLTEIVIPDGITDISYAFGGCTGLTEIVIPDGVTNISGAFSGCTGLTEIVIPDGVTDISGAFEGCTGLTEIVIPDGVTDMYNAFDGCTGLTEIVIPDSVTDISWAFYGCTGLTEIVIPDGVTDISWAFEGCTGLTEIVIPDGVTDMYSAFNGCTGLAEIVIPDGVTDIRYAFENCTDLAKVVIPKSVTDLTSAFYGCTGLKEVAITNGVTEIGNYAFRDCTSLSKITIPESITKISLSAFNGCTGLTTVVLNDSITHIYPKAFENCSAIKDVYYTGSEESWKKIAIGDCNQGLTDATIHYNYSVIPANVKATAGDGEVDITWDKVYGATAYRVRRNDGTKWATIANVTTNSYKDSAVTNGTKYTYGVLAYVDGVWSSASALVTAIPETIECVPPANVKATAGDSVIDITWDEVRGATAYRVRRHDGTKWATLANVTATSYKDTAVTNGTKYTYGILAQVNGEWSAASTLVAATPAAPYECVPPTGVKATAGDSVVNVTWNAVEGATAYRVRRHDGTKWATLANVTETSYKDSAVTNGTKYTYGILAQVNGTWSAASTLVAATPAAPFECVPPTGVKATGDDGVITVTWNAVEGATAYRVRRNDGTAWATLGNVTTTSYKDTAVTNGTKYTYGIFAQVNGKWSAASALVTATPEAIECIPPASVTIKSESGKVSLNWSAVNGATKYRVRRSDGNSWVNLASVSATSYVDSSVTNGTDYVYGIFAYVEGAWSAASALVQAKPAAVVSGVANGLTITTTADSITLSWDVVDGAEKYRVRRSDGVAWATEQTSAKTTFVDTDVVAGTTYKYSIYCYSDGAFGAPSSTVAAIL